MDQTSILRFIEENWSLGRIQSFDFTSSHPKPLLLDPGSGEPVKK